jgi:thioredoxin reductase (NADPH)
MIALVFTGGDRRGQKVKVATAIATVGRSPSCDIVVDDPMVSGVHATLEQVPAGYIVTDQQSSNGTLINGDRIARALLRVGDELIVGSTGLRVENSDGFAALIMHRSTGPVATPHEATMMPGSIASIGPMVLEILGAMGQGVTTTPMPAGGLVIGRHPDCGCVVNDPQVSGKHARIVQTPEGTVITDLGSSNGTFVNEVLLEKNAPRLVAPSDAMRVGGLTLRVRPARQAQVGQQVQPATRVADEPPKPQPPKWFLDVTSGMPAARHEITAGAPFTIGRLPTSSLVMTDPQSSGQHCEVSLGADSLLLSDASSRNGTFSISPSGEKRVMPGAPVPLRHGDSFRVGSVIFKAARVQLQAAKLQPTSPQRQIEASPASVLGDLPVEQHVPKQLLGARITFIAGQRAGTASATMPIERVVTHIGRASDNDVTLEDPSVSARHCRLEAQERGFVIVDNKSTNGCFVNGERVKGERPLTGGDLIRVGLDAVFEFMLEGASAQTFSGSSVVAEGAVSGGISPRFVIRGSVVKKWRAVIGRDVASDVFIDDPQVARASVEIEFKEMKFVARALAPGALVVNGKIEGEEVLKTGDELTIGKWQLRMEVSGARLTIHEKLDAVGANVSWAREAESSAQAPVSAEAAQVASVGGRVVFQTMFAADQVQLDKIVPKREKKKAAPKWKTTSDLQPDRNRSGAALIGLVAAGVILAILFVGKKESALLDGPLARGHDSQKFASLAKEHKLQDGCNSCHTPMKKVAEDRCQTCHTGFAPKHGVGAQAGHDHVSAKLQCSGCHEEHKGADRGEALVAKASCAKSGCHDARNPPHQKLAKEQPTPFVMQLKMPAPAKVTLPKGDAKQSQDKLHAIHGNVTHKCMACHTASDGKSAGVATSACIRCHDAPQVTEQLSFMNLSGAAPDSSACLGCHAMHDQTLARAPDAVMGARWTGGVSGKKTGGAAALAVTLMFFLVGGLASAYFGRRVDAVARLMLDDGGGDKKKSKSGEGAAAGEEIERKNDHAGVKLKVNVNKEKCVGCACCVNACPTAVLEIVAHKSTVTAEANCTSCRECETVCPSGALTMAPEGAPPRLIDMPDLDSHFQTNVAGLYLIGEAAGKSLVKNAANLGKVVVDHMVYAGLRPGDAQRLGADVEVLSVGSGPGGLSVALTAKSHGLSFAVIEKDRVYASTIQYCPKGKEFLAEPFDVENVSLLPISDCTKEDLIAQWDVVLRREQIDIRLGEEVLDLKKEDGMFVVTTSRGIIKTLRVVMSPGTRGSPRKLGVPGQELDKVSYMLIDPGEHQGHHVMVVGGGDSAVECAMALAAQPGNIVTLSYRKDAFARIKPRNAERIDEHIKSGKVKAIFSSSPTEVRPGSVVLKVGNEMVEVPNQYLYCLLGADLPMTWLQQLGVKYVKKPEGWNPGPTDRIVVGGQVAA